MHNSYGRLSSELKKLKRVMIAFSGGTDSTFLCAAAVDILGRDNVHAVTAVSATYPTEELRRAKSLARRLGVRHSIVVTGELNDKRFSSNPANRCFYCKDELFRMLSLMAKKERMVLCDGNNASDRNDFRPGRMAARKWKVRSPLEAADLSKEAVRTLSRSMKLPTWNLPAQACLASRIPYGTTITGPMLKRIAAAERILRRGGFRTFRLRHHGDIARIEVGNDELNRFFDAAVRRKILHGIKKLGWRYVTVDLEGYRCGSLNPVK